MSPRLFQVSDYDIVDGLFIRCTVSCGWVSCTTQEAMVWTLEAQQKAQNTRRWLHILIHMLQPWKQLFLLSSFLLVLSSHLGENLETDLHFPQGNQPVLFQPASEFLPMIDEVGLISWTSRRLHRYMMIRTISKFAFCEISHPQVYKELVEQTKSTPGAMVENNKFCVSVHFRRVDEKVCDT